MKKKKKILVIGLPFLTLSIAGAVTSTVAWYTANRINRISSQSITAINPESGTNMILESGQGTTVDSTDNHRVVISDLRDGSVDVENEKVFASILGDSDDVVGYRNIGNNYSAGNGIFYAATFTGKFHLEEEMTTLNSLHFISESSSCTFTSYNSGTSTYEIRNALRIGMRSSAGEWFVWAPYIAKSSTNPVTYVDAAVASGGELDDGEATLSNDNLIKTSSPIAHVDTNDVMQPGYQNNVEYLGLVPSLHEQGQPQSYLTVTFYVWFEGTDSNCDNSAYGLDLTFSANLTFKTYRIA